MLTAALGRLHGQTSAQDPATPETDHPHPAPCQEAVDALLAKMQREINERAKGFQQAISRKNQEIAALRWELADCPHPHNQVAGRKAKT